MTTFACGRCTFDYNRKHAPRYISAAETEYPVSLPGTCAQCNEFSTRMVICLGCALENNQCQNCRQSMFGVSEDLLAQVRDFRFRFNQSVASQYAQFTSIIAGFKNEVDEFLGDGELAQASVNQDSQELTAREWALRYGLYLEQLKQLPAGLLADYRETKKDLDLCLRADRDVFAILVENAFALERLRRDHIYNLTRAVSARLPSFAGVVLPLPIETGLVDYAQKQLTEEERQEIQDQRRRSFEIGKSIYEQMSAQFSVVTTP